MKNLFRRLFTAALISFSLGVLAHAIVRSLAGEVGTNDFRISSMGDNTNLFDTLAPSVAHNSEDNEYLVVWSGDDTVTGEFEIHGQIVDGQGTLVWSEIRISSMGPNGNTTYDALHPKVAYNSVANEYLVVWDANDNTAPLISTESEIYGQRVAADGTLAGGRIRISTMGPDGTGNFDATYPDVAYNSRDNEYMVVWHADDNTAPLVNDEHEIYGQRISAAGATTGSRIRISTVETDGNAAFDAEFAHIAYNSQGNEYLVVWEQADSAADEVDIYGQTISAQGAATGAALRVSDMGPNGAPVYYGIYASVAFNSLANEYLVVWYGADTATQLTNGVAEIYGQRISAAGVEVGSNDFQITQANSSLLSVIHPHVTYASQSNRYFVVFEGSYPGITDEPEIFAVFLNASGAVDGSVFRLTDVGAPTFTSSSPETPAVAYNAGSNQILAVFSSEDNPGVLAVGETEILGQLYEMPTAAVTNVDSVRVYPNPFRPSLGHAAINFADLPANAEVKIYTLAGRLVRTITATGAGTASWDTKNDAGDNVSSGVYYVLIEGPGGTNTTKIAVQR